MKLTLLLLIRVSGKCDVVTQSLLHCVLRHTTTHYSRAYVTSNYYLLSVKYKGMGTAVAQRLRFCATNRKVAGTIADGVIDIILPIALWPCGRLSL